MTVVSVTVVSVTVTIVVAVADVVVADVVVSKLTYEMVAVPCIVALVYLDDSGNSRNCRSVSKTKFRGHGYIQPFIGKHENENWLKMTEVKSLSWKKKYSLACH